MRHETIRNDQDLQSEAPLLDKIDATYMVMRRLGDATYKEENKEMKYITETGMKCHKIT